MGLLPKGLNSRAIFFVSSDNAIILHWDGIPIPSDRKIKGNKMGVTQLMLNFCFKERKVKKEHIKAIVLKSLEYKVVSKQDIENFLNGV